MFNYWIESYKVTYSTLANLQHEDAISNLTNARKRFSKQTFSWLYFSTHK